MNTATMHIVSQFTYSFIKKEERAIANILLRIAYSEHVRRLNVNYCIVKKHIYGVCHQHTSGTIVLNSKEIGKNHMASQHFIKPSVGVVTL